MPVKHVRRFNLGGVNNAALVRVEHGAYQRPVDRRHHARSGGLRRLLRIDHAPALGGDRPIDRLAGRWRFKVQAIVAVLIPLRRVLILYNGLRNLGSGRSRRRCADHCGANRGSGYAGGDGQHSSSGNFLGACHEGSPGAHSRKQRQGRTSVPDFSTKCCISRRITSTGRPG